MIAQVIKQDWIQFSRLKSVRILWLFLIVIGFVIGFTLNFTPKPDLAINSPYTISLFSSIWSIGLLFLLPYFAIILIKKEEDSNLNALIFTYPFSQKAFNFSRFVSFFTLGLYTYSLFFFAFGIGLEFHPMSSDTKWLHYVVSFVLFGLFNCFFICSILYHLSKISSGKLVLALGGVFIFVIYMMSLLFSNSPFFANGRNQSYTFQIISSLLDPFGQAAYFLFEKEPNYLYFNRICVLLIGVFLLYRSINRPNAILNKANKKGAKEENFKQKDKVEREFFEQPNFGLKNRINALLSFTRLDSKQTINKPGLYILIVLTFLYFVVHLYSEIFPGIRIPERTLNSGLIVNSLNTVVYTCLSLGLIYFVSETFWRSKEVGITSLQETTYYKDTRYYAHLFSLSIMVLGIHALFFIVGVLTDVLFTNPYTQCLAFEGMLYFSFIPSVILLYSYSLINQYSKSKEISIIFSLLCFVLFCTSILDVLFGVPVLSFLNISSSYYSSINGFGREIEFQNLKSLAFLSLVLCTHFFFLMSRRRKFGAISVFFLVFAVYLIFMLTQNLRSVPPNWALKYETKYKKYESLPKLKIQKLKAQVDLFPDRNSYKVKGTYNLVNPNAVEVDSVFIYVPPSVDHAILRLERGDLETTTQVAALNSPLTPGDSIQVYFEFSYLDHIKNSSHYYNQIEAKSSFSRISRFFPKINYQEEIEEKDALKRKDANLNLSLGTRPYNSVLRRQKLLIDTIVLDISSPKNHVPIASGDLSKTWMDDQRNYSRYEINKTPFRFAISSASYQISQEKWKSVNVQTYLSDNTTAEAERLLEIAKYALEYCQENFGNYPFMDLNIVQVPSSVGGFNGTAYPSTIFLNESKGFSSKLNLDEKPFVQDVLIELVSHEIAHLWWGNTWIIPDDREGQKIVTEGLAMYTQMMVYKSVYGEMAMQSRLDIQKQLLENQLSFSKNKPLMNSDIGDTAINYQKSAIQFVKLSEMIGEENLNSILKQYLFNSKTSDYKATLFDLYNEILLSTPEKIHPEITNLFFD